MDDDGIGAEDAQRLAAWIYELAEPDPRGFATFLRNLADALDPGPLHPQSGASAEDKYLALKSALAHHPNMRGKDAESFAAAVVIGDLHTAGEKWEFAVAEVSRFTGIRVGTLKNYYRKHIETTPKRRGAKP